MTSTINKESLKRLIHQIVEDKGFASTEIQIGASAVDFMAEFLTNEAKDILSSNLDSIIAWNNNHVKKKFRITATTIKSTIFSDLPKKSLDSLLSAVRMYGKYPTSENDGSLTHPN